MYSRDRKPLREWGWFEVLGALAGVLLGVILLLIVEPERVGAAEPAWSWPLGAPADVTRTFDPPAHRYASGHRGADLAGSPGAPVVAAGAGHVTYAGLLAGRGVVVVSHGDLRTTYEPVRASVAVGQAVTAGQVLGTLEAGHAGCPASACLHWGLRRGDTYLDPVQLVDAGPARLLPVGPPAVAAGGVPAAAPPVRPPSSGDRSARPTTPAAAVAEPDWSLRTAEAPLGAAAVAALAAGLVLLARPRHPPDGPATAGAAAAAAPDPAADPAADPASDGVLPVDLTAERLRRRVG